MPTRPKSPAARRRTQLLIVAAILLATAAAVLVGVQQRREHLLRRLLTAGSLPNPSPSRCSQRTARRHGADMTGNSAVGAPMALDLPETTTEVGDLMTAAANAQIDAETRGQPPTDAQLREFYQANRSAYATPGTMSLRDFVLHVGGYQDMDQSTAQAETDAAEAIYQLRSGAAIDRLMQHYVLVDSGRADSGETLDFAAKLHLGPKLFAVAETLMDGQISDPVPDFDGVHVLVMEQRYPPRVPDFGAVRAKVYRDYLNAAAKREQQAGLKILRRDAQIIVAPGQP